MILSDRYFKWLSDWFSLNLRIPVFKHHTGVSHFGGEVVSVVEKNSFSVSAKEGNEFKWHFYHRIMVIFIYEHAKFILFENVSFKASRCIVIFFPPPLWFVDSWSFCTLITVWATGTWLDNKHGLFLSCCWTLVNSLSRYLLLLVLSLLLFLSALLARTCL